MAEDSGKSRKWAANIAFVGDESKVKALIKQFQQAEENGDIADFTRIDGPHEKLQDLLKDRVKNLGLPSANGDSQKVLAEPDEVAYKSDYEQDMPTDDYDEDLDE